MTPIFFAISFKLPLDFTKSSTTAVRFSDSPVPAEAVQNYHKPLYYTLRKTTGSLSKEHHMPGTVMVNASLSPHITLVSL